MTAVRWIPGGEAGTGPGEGWPEPQDEATPGRTSKRVPVRLLPKPYTLCLAATDCYPEAHNLSRCTRSALLPLPSPLPLFLLHHFSRIIMRQLYQTVAGPCPRTWTPDHWLNSVSPAPPRVAWLAAGCTEFALRGLHPSLIVHVYSSPLSAVLQSLGGIINATLALWCEEGAACLPLLFPP